MTRKELYRFCTLYALATAYDSTDDINYYDDEDNDKLISWEKCMIERDIRGLATIQEPKQYTKYFKTMNWKAWFLGFSVRNSSNTRILTNLEYALKHFDMFDFSNAEDADLCDSVIRETICSNRQIVTILIDYVLEHASKETPLYDMALKFARAFGTTSFSIEKLHSFLES